ncbi:SpoIIE family protein phosphatase [Streptomyces kanasensis]|uniref:SpoIIE family protein phosphatase n=1 Tax=Streptomyces kanasensis TaxID=936756 RepID=UPI0036FF027A
MERSVRRETRELGAALTAAMERTGASVGMVYLLPPEGRTLRLAVLSGVPLDIAAPWTRVALGDPVPVADAVSQARLVWLGDQEEMARRYPRPGLVLPYRFSLAALPLTADGTPWGGLVVLWPAGHPPTLSPEEAEVLRTGAGRMADVLRTAAGAGDPLLPGPHPFVAHAPGPAPGQTAAALAFADRLPGGSCALDLDGRVTFVTRTAAELLGLPRERLVGTFPWEALPWLDAPVVEDRYRAALISRETTAFTAVRPPGHRLRFRLHPDATGISVRVIPLPDAPEAGSRPRPARAPARRRSATPGVPGRAGTLYHLMHLAAMFTEAVGVQDVAERTAEQMTPALGARSLALLLAGDGRLRLVGHSGCDPDLAERLYSVPVGAGTPEVRAFTGGTPLFFQSAQELRAAYPSAGERTPEGAWAFVPLIASGRPVGSLVLGFDRPRGFHSPERAVLSSLAGLIAQALDRARLYDAKHDLVHSLQAGLLPHGLPRVSGLDVSARYLPAAVGMDVGGDFYDVIRLGDTTCAVTIGDVQGHNVDAAALMGQVRTAVHATAGAPPGEVLARTNRLLLDLDPGLFTSCLYAHLDLARHSAVLATAGHPPPLCRHPDGRTASLDVPPGLLLGIDATATYPETEVPLPPGTLLALFTDGLVEVPGVHFDTTTADLAARISRGDPTDLDALADAVVEHACRTAPRNDDMALVLLRTHP